LEYARFGESQREKLLRWATEQIREGVFGDELLSGAEQFLLFNHVALPGESVLKRLLAQASKDFLSAWFLRTSENLPPSMRRRVDRMLEVPEDRKSKQPLASCFSSKRDAMMPVISNASSPQNATQ
jgi:hypothetical protein